MNNEAPIYSLKTFLPLIVIFGIIAILTTIMLYIKGFGIYNACRYFMGFFFIIFGAFKLANWQNFVHAYKMYDIIAQQSTLYAYLYPLIEVGLGIGYLVGWQVQMLNIITLVIMLVGSIGVAKELFAGNHITCACLGAVFNIPMTWVTLLEDLLMAVMAIAMLIW